MQTKLAAEASQLSRKIFASLPWGFRLAHLLSKLAIDTQEAFGRLAYAEFLKAGVNGLPDIQGQPALNFREKFKGPRAADKLPRGYGKDFGVRVWKIAMAKFYQPEVVEEAISQVMIKMVSGGAHLREGSDLKTAEAFVITAVMNAATDALRKKKRNVSERSLIQDDGDGGSEEIDISDPNAFRDMERMVPHSEMAKIMRDLKKVDDRAPSWVEAQLEGLSNVDIAEQWNVSPTYVTKWVRQYTDDIQEVFAKYFREAA